MSKSLILFGAALFASAASIPAIQVPDLSGTWVATTDTPPKVGAAPSAVFGERFALEQSDTQLTLTRPVRGQSPVVTVLPLDGTEVTVPGPSRPCLGQSAQVISTRWEADVLRYSLMGARAPGATTVSRRATPFDYRFRLQTPDTLVLETLMQTSAGAPPTAVGTVYRRSTERLAADAGNASASFAGAPAAISQIAWLAGNWTGARGTSTIEERWSPANGGAMIATSRTVRADVMTAFEFLCLFERDGTLVYRAMPNGGVATDFTLTQIDATSATFENPAHDFPKLIRYTRREDGGMNASISAGGESPQTTFTFDRDPRSPS